MNQGLCVLVVAHTNELLQMLVGFKLRSNQV